jgi:hypothetical protein
MATIGKRPLDCDRLALPADTGLEIAVIDSSGNYGIVKKDQRRTPWMCRRASGQHVVLSSPLHKVGSTDIDTVVRDGCAFAPSFLFTGKSFQFTSSEPAQLLNLTASGTSPRTLYIHTRLTATSGLRDRGIEYIVAQNDVNTQFSCRPPRHCQKM